MNYYELVVEPPDPIDRGGNGSGSGGASGVASNISLITSSGGLSGDELGLIIPCFDVDSPPSYYFATFDVTNYNTEDDCEIWFRAEDIIEGREITVSRVRLLYRDLGKCKVSCTVDTAQGSLSQTITVGAENFDGKIKTAYFDLVVTGERPQLKLKKLKNDGPLNIISVTMITGVEMAEQM